MGSTAKALKLLDYFSASRPTIGLTEFAKLAGYDKATTHRRLADLNAAGFVEQDRVSRSYRLGPAVLRLANVRESTFPTRESALPALQRLSDATGETVHLSLAEGDTGLATIAHLLSNQNSTRVHIDESEILPYHATASGLVVLAYGPSEFRKTILSKDLKASTQFTVTDRAEIENKLDQIESTGFAISSGGFEADVVGMATPVFDAHGNCNGAVAVASPSSRSEPERQRAFKQALQSAAQEITKAWGGAYPDPLKKH